LPLELADVPRNYVTRASHRPGCLQNGQWLKRERLRQR
jgi:hypothetical protein